MGLYLIMKTALHLNILLITRVLRRAIIYSPFRTGSWHCKHEPPADTRIRPGKEPSKFIPPLGSPPCSVLGEFSVLERGSARVFRGVGRCWITEWWGVSVFCRVITLLVYVLFSVC